MEAQTTAIRPELREKKSIGICILLSFVTCGIYLLIWLYSICKKISLLAGEDGNVIGEYLLMLFIPFYGLYWVYSRGKKLYSGMQKNGISASDNSVLYLILQIFGLGIITYSLMQNELNTVAAA